MRSRYLFSARYPGLPMRAAKKLPAKPVTLTAKPLTVSPPVLGSPTLSVGDIAERLSALAPDATATVERLRHWTREGLLAPVDQHRGTGKHRRYNENVAFDAAVLTALADAGLQITRPYIRSALAQARAAMPSLLKARRDLFLMVTHRLDSEPLTEVRETAKPSPDALLTIVVNLAQLFRQLRP
jgi:DNA-binding transcriptional MerR regulator